jgi:GNAT superfamily N-acetyltransferase
VEEATTATAEVVAAIQRLVPQLSSSAAVPTADDVAAIVSSPATVLLVARLGDGEPIAGTLTLALFRLPTGVRAWIEDVVTDQTAQRRGVGTALIGEALQRATEAGARTVDLTSRAAREDANRLYQHLGFARRDTNVYRWTAS